MHTLGISTILDCPGQGGALRKATRGDEWKNAQAGCAINVQTFGHYFSNWILNARFRES